MTGTWGLIECLFLDIESVLQFCNVIVRSVDRVSENLLGCVAQEGGSAVLVLFKYLCSLWLSSDRMPAGNGIVVASHNNGVL